MTTYEVHIRRVADGVVRVHTEHDPKDHYLSEYGDGYSDFMWRDGNFACDCNRDLFFKRAGGELERDETDECPCDDGVDRKYLIEKIVVKGGSGEVLYTETT